MKRAAEKGRRAPAGRKRRGKGSVEQGGVMEIRLSDPGMSWIHKAGLAGLWMTLDALGKDRRYEGDKKGLLELGEWELSDTAVRIEWRKREFFDRLIGSSFQLTKRGLLFFPALAEAGDHPGILLTIQEAVLNTFIQHGKKKKFRSSQPDEVLTVRIDDQSVSFPYRRLLSYHLMGFEFDPTRPGEVDGSLIPGGAVRHVVHSSSTSLEAPPGQLLALLYTVVGCVFFRIRKPRLSDKDVRHEYAVVVPAVKNLRMYARTRKLELGKSNVEEFQVASPSEAALRLLTLWETRRVSEGLGVDACRVISFGVTPFARQQKTVVEVTEVRVDDSSTRDRLKVYEVFHRIKGLRPHWRGIGERQEEKGESAGEEKRRKGRRKEGAGAAAAEEEGGGFWVVPQTPGFVAENLVAGRPWWWGFADWLARNEKIRDNIKYERGGIAMAMKSPDVMPESPEKVLVLACQEAWRRRQGALGERAKREGLNFGDLVERERERLRVLFLRCKNAATLREAVTDFWSRAGGPLESLRGRWPDILPFLQERWREGRDLALLALASYASDKTAAQNGTSDSAANG